MVSTKATAQIAEACAPACRAANHSKDGCGCARASATQALHLFLKVKERFKLRGISKRSTRPASRQNKANFKAAPRHLGSHPIELCQTPKNGDSTETLLWARVQCLQAARRTSKAGIGICKQALFYSKLNRFPGARVRIFFCTESQEIETNPNKG